MSTLIIFIQKAIAQGIGMLFGATGEIITEKSGNLNLGVPGLMYMGGIAGLMGAFVYENGTENPIGIVGVIVSMLCTLIASGLGALIYSVLTITLRANQNVTGLALTTFGVGFGNFFGGSLSQLAGGVGQISVAVTGATYKTKIPGLSKIPVIGDILFSYGFMTYFGIILAILVSWFMFKTRKGLNLRAIGESPATADAAGINVALYKYAATVLGGARGWLAIALVIFALWKPINAIWGSFLFGALYILYLYIPGLGRSMQEIFKMLPYLVTIIVLIFTSFRKKKEYQPPESLGNSYFREDR